MTAKAISGLSLLDAAARGPSGTPPRPPTARPGAPAARRRPRAARLLIARNAGAHEAFSGSGALSLEDPGAVASRSGHDFVPPLLGGAAGTPLVWRIVFPPQSRPIRGAACNRLATSLCGEVEPVRATRLLLVLALVVVGCAGPRGTVDLVNVGPAPDPDGSGAMLGASALQATFEVKGPIQDGVVVCKFTGRHGIDNLDGWHVYTLVGDLMEGESTQGTCQAIAFPPLGDEEPSQPVVSLTTKTELGAAPAGVQVDFVPATPWPDG